jgi:hypothetical protein
MKLYFLLLDAARFHQQIVSALGAAWRQRSFAPCQSLCAELAATALGLGERTAIVRDEPLLCRVPGGLPFDRDLWRLLVGEVLLYAAAEMPELRTAPDTLATLLSAERAGDEPLPRERFTPIHAAHWGGRDLVFGGGFYRPESAGYNDVADVARLAAYLTSIDPAGWTTADLAALPGLEEEEDRVDELEFARECLAALRETYQRAAAAGQVIVCERP